MIKRTGLLLAVASAAIISTSALAQIAPPPEPPETAPVGALAPTTGQRYAPADFATFSPRTALDMVQQIPGFTIRQLTGGGDRGLGAARENILINGERIADKSTDAETSLSRINAASVAYIEIVDGARLNVPGLTGQVANIVLAEGASKRFVTTIRWTPEVRPRLPDNWLWGEISTAGTIGGTNVTLSLTSNPNRQGHWGPERVFDAAGNLLFVREEFGRYFGDRPGAALVLARTAANGNKLNFNLGGQLVDIRNSVAGTSLQPGTGRVDELFTVTEDEWNANISADYDFGLGRGRLKLIGQHRAEHSPVVRTFTIATPSGPATGSRFDQTADENESILRGEYGWRSVDGTDWQIALEGAYNLLDVDAELALLQPDGSFQPIIFGGELTRVDEKRAEASLTWGRGLADNLTAQVNLGLEYSKLSSSGPGGLSRSFIRPKGRLALAWKPGPRTTLNYVLQRRVDQLNFFDFASSVDVANNNGNTGNGQLVPPITNRTELELVQDLGAWGNVSVAVAHAIAEDLVDQVPLSPTTEGRGNLRPAKLYRLSSRATLLLDPVGLKGVRFNSDITLRRNRVRDPLTNVWRDQSGGQEYLVDLGLRHDIAGSNWAWGATYFDERQSPELRLDEIADEFTGGPFVTAFVEHKNVAGFTVRAELRNLATMQDALDRTVFVDRRTGPIDFTESRRRGFGRIFKLTVTGTL
ncbi:MAG: TonB-dependent receptor plug domain-containing protein [Sphingopyxis sp.]|nr:TonB-dependent receptor plug domain-containing protein [Sphingopyxis sp.]